MEEPEPSETHSGLVASIWQLPLTTLHVSGAAAQSSALVLMRQTLQAAPAWHDAIGGALGDGDKGGGGEGDGGGGDGDGGGGVGGDGGGDGALCV